MENLGAELCYLAQLPPDEQFTIRLLIIRALGYNMFLVCRANLDNPFLDEDIEYSNEDIFHFSPIALETYAPVITGDVVEARRVSFYNNILHLESITFIEKANAMTVRIEKMIETMNDVWIQKDYVSNRKSLTVKEESEIDASLLHQLPFEMKFEIISYIPTYSKQERIKIVERNVRTACKLLKISEDEFNEKYCDQTSTPMRIEKRLNPDRLYEMDNDFIRYVKMRLINKEFAKIMKENIMKLDLLYIYRDDKGMRPFVRASIELARRDYFKDPSLNPISLINSYSQIENHVYPYGYNDLNITCAPSFDELSRFNFALSWYEHFGLSSNEIFLMEKTDFCVNRKELKLYRPTFILEEFKALLRNFSCSKLEMYCLYFDTRVSKFIVDELSTQSYIITLHKRDFCKRIQRLEQNDENPPIQINLFEIEEYHPLMDPYPIQNELFFYMDLLQTKRMLDSILNNNHSLILDTTNNPSHLNKYFSQMCQDQSGGKFNAKPSVREAITDYEFIDAIRNSKDTLEKKMHKTLCLFTVDSKLRSYFYRPYISFSGSYLSIDHYHGSEIAFAFQEMEEPELSYQDKNGLTVLHYIAESDIYIPDKILREKLDKYPHLLNICDNTGRVPTDIVKEPCRTNFLRKYIEENEITIEPQYILNPFEIPSKKQKRIDSYFKKK